MKFEGRGWDKRGSYACGGGLKMLNFLERRSGVVCLKLTSLYFLLLSYMFLNVYLDMDLVNCES